METIIDMYLKYLNDFVIAEKFAEFYWLDDIDAKTIIDMGRKYHDRKAEFWIKKSYEEHME